MFKRTLYKKKDKDLTIVSNHQLVQTKIVSTSRHMFIELVSVEFL